MAPLWAEQLTLPRTMVRGDESAIARKPKSNGGFRAPVARADRGGGKNDVDDEASLRGVRRAVVAGERRCGARGARRLRRSFSQHLSSRGIEIGSASCREGVCQKGRSRWSPYN